MLESLYSFSNELAELALEEKPIPPELIRKALREGCISMKIQPVLCGSALHGMGIQPLLDGVGYYLPSPLDRPPVVGVDPKKRDKQLERKPSAKEPFCALVFKILRPKPVIFTGSASTRAHLKQTRASTIPTETKKRTSRSFGKSMQQRRNAKDRCSSSNAATLLVPSARGYPSLAIRSVIPVK